MTAARQQSQKQGADAQRKAALAKVHQAAKDCGHDDTARRDVIERVTGKRSAGQLTLGQLDQVVRHYKDDLGWKEKPRKRKASQSGGRKRQRAGDRPVAPGAVRSKARALWIALYHLGEVHSPEEKALDAFVRRQLGYDSLRFLPAPQASSVIDALKAWCHRAGFPAGDTERRERIVELQDMVVLHHGPRDMPVPDKVILIEALWQKLIDAGVMTYGIHARLDTWLQRQGYGVDKAEVLTDAQADDAIERLGAWYRRVRGA